MRQWQGYVKNSSAIATQGYSHFLGVFFGMGEATSLPNVTVQQCRAHCDGLNASTCGGFTFVSDEPEPTVVLGMPVVACTWSMNMWRTP